MIQYTLPETVMIDGQEVPIRSDYRAILDICVAMQDIDLTDTDKAYVALKIFYKTEIPFTEEALNQVFWFINCGQEENAGSKKQLKLFDWEQDFQLIIAPINRLTNCDVRGIPHLHWWTFMGYFQEIGDCLFSRVVAIRSKRSKGKKLDDVDKEFYRDNKELVDFKRKKYKPSALLQQLVQGGARMSDWGEMTFDTRVRTDHTRKQLAELQQKFYDVTSEMKSQIHTLTYSPRLKAGDSGIITNLAC